MRKFREFKEIATNVGLVLKKYWFYKQNLKTYLTTKEFSEEEFQKIEKDLALNLEWKTYIEEFGQDNTQEEARTSFIKLLMIESLYNNHELFKKLKTKYPQFNLPKECREVVFKKSFNELVKTINYKELEKNIDFLNDSEVNLVVLEKAFLSSDKNLYEYISSLVDWTKDEKTIKNHMLLMIAKNGNRLIESSFATEIKSHIKKEDIINFFTKENGYFLDKKVAQNMDNFLGMDILYELINEEEINKELPFYSSKNNKKEFKHIISKIDKTKDYSHIIKNYLEDKFRNLELKDKIILLDKEGLLTDLIWDKLIDKENHGLLNLIFMKQNQLLPYLGKEKLEKISIEYKNALDNISNDKDLIKDFIEQYDKTLEKEELITLINKRYSYVVEEETTESKKESIHALKEKQKEMNLVNHLFQKYPQIMLEEDSIVKITNQTRNDIFIKYYLLKLSQKMTDNNQWKKLIDTKNKNLLKIVFNNQDSFKLLNNENKEKVYSEYKNVIFKSIYESNEVINFIEKYPYQLNNEEVIELIDKVHNYLKVVSPTEKEATDLVKEKYIDQLTITSMLPSHDYDVSHYLTEEKKLVDKFFEKYPENLINPETLIKIVQSSHNDIFLSTYLTKYFELNNDEDLKKKVVRELSIFDQSSFGNTLEWVINNNLLLEIFPINEYVSIERNLLTNKAWNGWIPLLVEQFDIKPDGLIKQTVASYISNDELFKFIVNNYELKPKTEQLLCNSIFAIDAVELAEELFKNGIVPNDYYAEKFKSAPTNAGNILLKAKLKEKLENKFENLDEQNKTKKVKKI